ncbi:bacteriocin-like protein [Chryseobacterium sp. MYb328]|uniref:bacteriocin-like protein n=1 Tax=Chryseobacterium sp. MYb328 TaxID=2745231 RepID=UPI0030B12A48
MKNLKKISKNELKNISGGLKNPKEYLEGEGGGGAFSTYRCCSNPHTCGGCSTGSNCPSGYYLQAC